MKDGRKKARNLALRKDAEAELRGSSLRRWCLSVLGTQEQEDRIYNVVCIDAEIVRMSLRNVTLQRTREVNVARANYGYVDVDYCGGLK